MQSGTKSSQPLHVSVALICHDLSRRFARACTRAQRWHPRDRLCALEGSIASKWLQLLTGMAPGVKRAMMLFNPDTAPFIQSYALPSFEAAARSLKVALIVAPVRNDTEIEAAVTELGREPGCPILRIWTINV